MEAILIVTMHENQRTTGMSKRGGGGIATVTGGLPFQNDRGHQDKPVRS